MRRTWFTNIAVLLTSTVFTLCAIEFFCRVLNIAPFVFRINPKAAESAFQLSENPILGYELKRNFRSTRPDNHQSFAYTNRHGFRDIERRIEKPQGVKRVIVLGDSVVAGAGLRNLDDTISRQLEERVKDRDVEVLNFGISGYCTLAEVELFRTRGLAFKPDLVVLVFVSNDYIGSHSLLMRWVRYDRPQFADSLFLASHLFRWTTLRTNLFHFREEFTERDRISEHAAVVGPNNVEQGFKLLFDLQREFGFEVVIATWPQFTDKAIYYDTNQYLDNSRNVLRVEELSRQQGFQVVRLDKAFEEHLKKSRRGSRFRRPSPKWSYTIGDGTHPSKDGARVASEALEAVIIPGK